MYIKKILVHLKESESHIVNKQNIIDFIISFKGKSFWTFKHKRKSTVSLRVVVNKDFRINFSLDHEQSRSVYAALYVYKLTIA